MDVWRIGKVSTVVIVVLLAVSCPQLGLGPSESDDNGEDTTIPDSVVEIAFGLTGLLDMVLSGDDPPTAPDSTEYPDGYPEGMSVEWVNDDESVLRFTLSDFAPPDDDDPATVNGSMTLTERWEDGAPTATLSVVGSFEMSNFTHDTCDMDAEAVFDADPATGEWTSEEPDSLGGTFTVDGVVYDFAEVLEAIEQLENGDDDDETPVSLTYSVTVSGLENPADFAVQGGELVAVVVPGDLTTDPEPDDILAVNHTVVDGSTHTLELREAVVNAAAGTVEPGGEAWERTLDAAYNLVVYLDTGSNGPDKFDYYAAGGGTHYYGVDCLPLPSVGGTVEVAFPDNFRLPPNVRPDLMPAQRSNVDVAVNQRFTFPLEYIDRDGDAVEIMVETAPSHGSLDLSDSSEVAYTPETDYTGDDSFSLYATDGRDESYPLTFGVRVLPAGDHVARFTAAQEEYVTFGSIEGFTHAGSWTLIERVKLPPGAGGGYHIGRASGDTWPEGDAPVVDAAVGDFAIRLDPTGQSNQINVTAMTSSGEVIMGYNFAGGLPEDTWFDICVVYDADLEEFTLYINGETVAGGYEAAPLDDRANSHELTLGGIPAAGAADAGSLVGESDIVIGNVAFYQRALSMNEIERYRGLVDPTDEDLYFATTILSDRIDDASANGRNGTNGSGDSAPSFLEEQYY